MRPYKSKQELIAEGYNAEAALVFLDDFFTNMKEVYLQKLLCSPDNEVLVRRAEYKTLCHIENVLKQEVETGIMYATEQPDMDSEREEEVDERG